LRGQSAKSAIGCTSLGPPSLEAQTRTTLIPDCAARARVSGILARSSSRYITATFAPTNRNGLPSTTKRIPSVATNCGRARPLTPPQLESKKETAALATSTDAAITNAFLRMELRKRGNAIGDLSGE